MLLIKNTLLERHNPKLRFHALTRTASSIVMCAPIASVVPKSVMIGFRRLLVGIFRATAG